jgi:hypothetical protein
MDGFVWCCGVAGGHAATPRCVESPGIGVAPAAGAGSGATNAPYVLKREFLKDQSVARSI